MDLFAMNLADIAELVTLVAINGALALADSTDDQLFETIVGVASLVYETYPD